MKKTFTVLMFFALHGLVVAQETIAIKLTDAKTLNSIPYAHIFNQSTKRLVTSNENGIFRVEGTSKDTIKISVLGYVTEVFVFSKLKQLKEVRLDATYEYLNEVVIEANQIKNLGVQHIDKLSLKLQPVNTAQDLLKTVSGLFIAQHAGGGKAEQIFLRGFDNDHGTDFGVFLDDIPINLSSHAHGQGYADMHFIIPELIQDGDYYKGPYELKNGNFVVSGAARFKTKNELSKNSVKLEVGDYGYQRALLALNLTPNNKLFTKSNYESSYLAIEGTLNKSFFDAPQKFKKISGLFKYNAELNDNTSLTFTSSYFNSEWDASGQIPLRAVNDGSLNWFGAIDDTEGGATARFNSVVKITSLLENEQSISNQLYFSNNQYQLFSNFTFFLNNPIEGDMIEQIENRNILGYTFEYERKDTFKNTNLHTILSAGFRSDWINSALDASPNREKIATITKDKITEVNYWVYVKENWQLNSQVLLQFGSRFDMFTFEILDQKGTNMSGKRDAFLVSPKASLFYNPVNNIQLFLKGGSGYHSNSTHAAIEDKTTHPLPKALAADIGTEFRIGGKFIASVALWTIKSDSEYIFVADTGDFENNGSSLRKGVDVSSKINPLKNIWLNISANYSKGKLLDAPKNENSIPAAPVFTSTGSIVYKHSNGLNLYLGAKFMGERPLNEDESVMEKDYFLLDASIHKTFKNIEIGLSVQNLFNIKWKEAVFYDASRLKNEVLDGVEDVHFTPGTPRYVKGSISYNF